MMKTCRDFLYTCDDTGMAEVTPEGWAEKDPQYGFVDTRKILRLQIMQSLHFFIQK